MVLEKRECLQREFLIMKSALSTNQKLYRSRRIEASLEVLKCICRYTYIVLKYVIIWELLRVEQQQMLNLRSAR